MWPHVQMRAVQGMRARRGVVDARVRSCHGVLGAHRSKERLSEHAGRDRVGVIVVRRLQGEAAIEGSPDFLQSSSVWLLGVLLLVPRRVRFWPRREFYLLPRQISLVIFHFMHGKFQ